VEVTLLKISHFKSRENNLRRSLSSFTHFCHSVFVGGAVYTFTQEHYTPVTPSKLWACCCSYNNTRVSSDFSLQGRLGKGLQKKTTVSSNNASPLACLAAALVHSISVPLEMNFHGISGESYAF